MSAVIKPSDAKSWSLCARRVWLDNQPGTDLIELDPFEQLVIDMGLAHEQTMLERLSQSHAVQTATSVDNTNQLMDQQIPVIYQAQLQSDALNMVGFPDFLLLHDNGEYQAADAKLSLNEEKKEIQAQLGCYRKLLANDLPAIVFRGDATESEIGDEANKVTEQFASDMRGLLDTNEEPLVHYSHSKCRACPYYTHCKPGFEKADALSLLYGIQGRSVPGLNKQGILTIDQLAKVSADTLEDVPYLKGEEKKQKAILQAQSWKTGKVYKLQDFSLPEGQWIHFDIEDNPLTASGEKHVYLWGFLVPDYSNDHFEYVWTDSADQDELGWRQFLGQVERYREQYAPLKLIHYSNHERTTIKKYAERYEMEDHATVVWLLSEEGPLYDIQKPVTDNLVLPLQGYGLKDICKHPKLVNFQWENEESGSQWSVVQFNQFLQEADPEIKAQLKTQILGYNRDDVIATRRLEEWLRTNYAS